MNSWIFTHMSTVQNMHLVLFLNMIVSRIQHNLNTIAFHIIVNPCICLSIFPDRSWITNKWGPDTRWFSRNQEFGEVIVSGSVSYNYTLSTFNWKCIIIWFFQIADVVVVARLLNATLAMPEIQSTTSSKGIRFVIFLSRNNRSLDLIWALFR
jgi:hypothetical protein